jgi:hypothetical protein
MTQIRTIQHTPLLRLVGSKSNTRLTTAPAFSQNIRQTQIEKPDDSHFTLRPHRSTYPHNTSFDATPGTPAWYVESPPSKSSLQLWFERRYYQYEVTWGLYALTPGEKVLINTLVMIMFSLVLYGVVRIAIIQQTARIVVEYVNAFIRESFVALQDMREFDMHNALYGILGSGASQDGSSTVVKHITMTTTMPTLDSAEL